MPSGILGPAIHTRFPYQAETADVMLYATLYSEAIMDEQMANEYRFWSLESHLLKS